MARHGRRRDGRRENRGVLRKTRHQVNAGPRPQETHSSKAEESHPEAATVQEAEGQRAFGRRARNVRG